MNENKISIIIGLGIGAFLIYKYTTPTLTPTFTPSFTPTLTPSTEPTLTPSLTPTFTPTFTPPLTPSTEPTFTPSTEPTFTPSTEPTFTPSTEPTFTPTPSFSSFSQSEKNEESNEKNVIYPKPLEMPKPYFFNIDEERREKALGRNFKNIPDEINYEIVKKKKNYEPLTKETLKEIFRN